MAKGLSTTPVTPTSDYALTLLEELDYAVDTNSKNVRGGPTTLYSILVTNDNAQAEHVKLYDDVSSGLVSGTTAPNMIFILPGGTTAWVEWEIPEGLPFTNGISLLGAQEAGNANTTDTTGTPDVYLLTGSGG